MKACPFRRRFLAAVLAIGLLPTAGAQSFNRLYDVKLVPNTSPHALDLVVYGKEGVFDTQPTGYFGTKSCLADLNGDGVDDLVVSAAANPGGRSHAGVVHVWFGGAGIGGLKDLETAPADLTILGASPEDSLTATVPFTNDPLTAADVNGDGISDLILGSVYADGPAEGRSQCGEAYIIFGRAVFPAVLDLAVQGAGGADVTIYGDAPNRFLTGNDGIKTGDLNDDGITGLILGATAAITLDGQVHVLFGRAVFPTVLDLAVAANSDVTIDAGDSATHELGGINGAMVTGDVNGDGTTDLIIADPRAYGAAGSRPESGEVYIIFGRALPAVFPAALNVRIQGSAGADVTIIGASPQDNLTGGFRPLLATGDVNGDGTADIVMGTGKADGPGNARTDSGELYVVLGRALPATFPATLDLAVQGAAGADVTIYGGTEFDELGGNGGLSLADMNGDGVTDLVAGARGADGGPLFLDRGAAYIVYGRESPAVFPATLDLAVQGPGGHDVRILGIDGESALTDFSSLATGDISGDGVADLIVSAPFRWSFLNTQNARFQSGETYIILGRASPQAFPAAMTVANADITLFGGYWEHFGAEGSVAVGDLNDDGLNDLLMTNVIGSGAQGLRGASGEAYVLFGRASASAADQEIAVEQPVGTGLADGTATVDFGIVNPGVSGAPVTFTIKNTGGLLLNVTSIGNSGGEAGDFAVTAPALPDVIWPGQEITCDVTFTPGAAGPRGTVLQIVTDDADEATFDITLAGTGNSPPALQLPASPVVVTATSPAGAIVNFSVTATDTEDTPDPTPVVTPPSGSLFPEGDTLVSVEVTDSGGLVTTDSFTVHVDPAGTYAAAWRQLHFGSPDNTGNAEDHFDADQDGIVNLMERFLGLNPNQAAPLPVALDRDGGMLEFTYPRIVLALPENTFTVQWSDDLTPGSWSDIGVTETIVTDDGTTQQILALVPEGAGRRFVRLVVTANP